ncbi:MAG TPA: heme d1 biosynthesis radical SAM protein NirJ [Candidatus Sulfotelmatobacter sp.]|jgi:heme d1 biosynthesis radical SAM protein NirJ|nr:heme d1 biosynthesis radical SAM protein NirJ [Candidatus Sulfotelmatobacter sp.]
MFRLSHLMRSLVAPEAAPIGGPRTRPTGPVVIWNLIRRCNLTCKHCYSLSADTEFKGELTLDEIAVTMADLKRFGVPGLILSGGEPLLRPDIFEIAELAKGFGFYVGLSSNGTLIDQSMAKRIAAAGFDYVGVSLDGIGPVHDAFRRKEGAFDASLAGVRFLGEAGVKAGLRFTMTQTNADQLPGMLDLVRREGAGKFYFSHLNYAGRGNHNRKDDAFLQTTRRAMELLFEEALSDAIHGEDRDWVTGNNDADGVFFLLWAQKRFPERAGALQKRLEGWGGNASGLNVANIDNLGEVHPDTMWWHHNLGNVRRRPFSEIWRDVSDPLMAGLKLRPRPVTGRCGQCRYLSICNGNTRTRAHQITGDFWAEDPGCYLNDDEIGVTDERRVTTTPFSHGVSR